MESTTGPGTAVVLLVEYEYSSTLVQELTSNFQHLTLTSVVVVRITVRFLILSSQKKNDDCSRCNYFISSFWSIIVSGFNQACCANFFVEEKVRG